MSRPSEKNQIVKKGNPLVKRKSKNEIALVEKPDKLALRREAQRAIIIPRGKFRMELVSTHKHAAKAVSKLVRGAHPERLIFGVDIQWNSDPYRYKARIPQKPVLIQVGRADGYCALFRMDYMGILPKDLKLLLKNPEIMKVGVGILYDAHLIKHHYSCKTVSALDIRHMANRLGVDPMGFDYLSKAVLGLDREFYIPTKDCWTNAIYSNPQKRFAAVAAVNSAKMFDKLNNDLMRQRWGVEWEDWTAEKYMKATRRLWKRYLDLPFRYPTNDPRFKVDLSTVLKLEQAAAVQQLEK